MNIKNLNFLIKDGYVFIGRSIILLLVIPLLVLPLIITNDHYFKLTYVCFVVFFGFILTRDYNYHIKLIGISAILASIIYFLIFLIKWLFF